MEKVRKYVRKTASWSGDEMSVKVRIPTLLQTITHGIEEADAPAGTVIAVINSLEEVYPGFGEKLIEGDRIKKFINIYVNEEDIRFLQGEQTQAKDGDEIFIIPAIAGGSSNSFSGEEEGL
jgi:sulfur-carrier protein